MKTLSTILGKEFEFSTTHVGTFLTDELWVHDKWIVVIEGQDFEYSTGIGHREAKSTFILEKEALPFPLSIILHSSNSFDFIAKVMLN